MKFSSSLRRTRAARLFVLFRLPAALARYFAGGKRIKLRELQGNVPARRESQQMAGAMGCEGFGCLCLLVLPMGRASAVGVMQALHRRLMTLDHPRGGAGLPTANEVRKSAVLPVGPDQRMQKAWQVYLDNLALFRVEKWAGLDKLEGAVIEWHHAARAAWIFWQIPSAADKSAKSAPRAQELGCYFDGLAGLLGAEVQRRLTTVGLCLY